MPPLFNRQRFLHFVALVGTGAGQAGVAVLIALAMPILLSPGSATTRTGAAAAMVLGACFLGWLRQRERVCAEQFGQSYVQEIRGRLIRAALDGRGPSLGVTVTRASNDLNSVRNWVALGISPLAVAVPVGAGVLGALAILDPRLVAGVACTLTGLVVVLLVLAGPTLTRSRELRRRRGRLAAHLTDTASAAPTIRASGGVDREVRRVLALADKVIEASIERARLAGWARGAGATAGTLALITVAGTAAMMSTPTPTVAAAMTVVGVLSGPMADLGRIVEYRQSFRAAVAVLEPAMAPAPPRITAQDGHRSDPEETGALVVRDLVIEGTAVPDLVAERGSVVVLDGPPERRAQVVAALAGLQAPRRGKILINGHDLAHVSPRQRRTLVGLAAPTLGFERSTIARAVRYRRPDSQESISPALARLGLLTTVESLPRGERTRLRHGGEPLDHRARALLHVARASYGSPDLIVLDHVERHLDPTGSAHVRSHLGQCHSAVVVLASDTPAALSDAQFVHWAV